jgi:hypothetical protein
MSCCSLQCMFAACSVSGPGSGYHTKGAQPALSRAFGSSVFHVALSAAALSHAPHAVPSFLPCSDPSRLRAVGDVTDACPSGTSALTGSPQHRLAPATSVVPTLSLTLLMRSPPSASQTTLPPPRSPVRASASACCTYAQHLLRDGGLEAIEQSRLSVVGACLPAGNIMLLLLPCVCLQPCDCR